MFCFLNVKQHSFEHLSHSFSFLLGNSILLLNLLLELGVSPVEQNLCALIGYQKTLHFTWTQMQLLEE